jgi:hypothetical protein
MTVKLKEGVKLKRVKLAVKLSKRVGLNDCKTKRVIVPKKG